MFIKNINIKNGFPVKIHGTKKNSYRWVPMISGHGTEKLFSMGFEILGLAFDSAVELQSSLI